MTRRANRVSRAAAGALLVATLATCDLAQQPTEPVPGDGRISCTSLSFLEPSMPIRPIDLVVVVSDAPSMLRYATEWSEYWPRFAEVLARGEGGLPSLRVAVVDASGAFASERLMACGVGGAFLDDVQRPWFQCDAGADDCRVRNYAGSLGDALRCSATMPADGASAPLLLERMREALDPATPDAAAFLRPDALLAILIISDDDDASPGPVEDYVDALRTARPDDALIAIALIGPQEAPRLFALLDSFPNRAARTTIERGAWADAVSFNASLGPLDVISCFEEIPDDVDPVLPGLQLDCVAFDSQDMSRPLIPRCEMAEPNRPAVDTPLPCYWVRTDRDLGVECPVSPIIERVAHKAGNWPTLYCPCDVAP